VAATPLSFFAGRRLLLAAVILSAVALVGCGRYGPLEPPPDPNAPKKPADANNPASLSKPSIPPITAPKQPFFLDFLLK
jgi:predicted small lipoprotein YifL